MDPLSYFKGDCLWQMLPNELIAEIFSYLPLRSFAAMTHIDQRSRSIALETYPKKLQKLSLKDLGLRIIKAASLFAVKNLDLSLLKKRLSSTDFIETYICKAESWSKPISNKEYFEFTRLHYSFIQEDHYLKLIASSMLAFKKLSLSNPIPSFESLIADGPFKELSSLKLDQNKILPQIIAHNQNHLTSINLAGWRSIDPQILHAVAGCQNLKELHLEEALSGNYVEFHVEYMLYKKGAASNRTGETIKGIRAILKNCLALEVLNCNNCDLYHEEIVAALLATPNKQLKVLDLSYAYFSQDPALERIIDHFEQLEQLIIYTCDDATYQRLSQKKPQLQFIRTKKRNDRFHLSEA